MHSGLAVAGERGVLRGHGRFAVSGEVLENVCGWAGDLQLQVAALVHTHKHGAGMSRIDRESGFRVDGFRSVIVPRFASPPSRPAAWGWYVFADEAWQRAVPGELAATGRGVVVVADEDGLR